MYKNSQLIQIRFSPSGIIHLTRIYNHNKPIPPTIYTLSNCIMESNFITKNFDGLADFNICQNCLRKTFPNEYIIIDHKMYFKKHMIAKSDSFARERTKESLFTLFGE